MRIFFTYILLAFSHFCNAQNMMRVTHLNVENGLSQSSVYSIMQDSYGFMWIATGDGLNRYDGRDFIAYKSKLNSTLAGQLKDRNINSIVHEDINHNLWFCADEGVYCMDRRTGRVTVKLSKYHTGYAAMLAGQEGNKIWFYIPSKGLHCFFTDGQNPKLYPPTSEPIDPYHPIFVKSVLVTPSGIWVVDENGLLFFNRQTYTDKRVLKMKGINDGYLLKSGQLALSVQSGIWLYNIATGIKHFIKVGDAATKKIQWDKMAEDTIQGNLYIGQLYGGAMAKLHLATGNNEVFTIQKNTINNLFIDRSQNLWIGTEGAGIYRMDIKPDRFFCYKPQGSNNASLMVKSIYKNDTGDVWLGTYAQGIIKYNTTTQKTTPVPVFNFTSDSYCGVIMKDSAGDILMTVNNSVIWADAATGRKKKEIALHNVWEMKDMPHVIYSVMEWQKGHYLSGTNQTIHTFTDKGSCKSLSKSNFFSDSVTNGWIYNLYRAHDGIIYIGKRNGYCGIRMVNDSTAHIVDRGLRNITIRHFYKSNTTPLLWLASEQGLIAWDSSTQKHTVFDETTSGIANSYVYAIQPENDSTFWISTNNGISRVAVQYKDGRVNAGFRNYSVKDGLQSSEFNTGAFFKCADGTMMFGGIAGLNWFHPQDVAPNPYKAIPAITGIYINDTLVTSDTAMYLHGLTLPHNRNTLSLTLRALEYTMPEQNMFAYRLIGVDNDWVQTSNDKVRYANLQPGSYRFQFKVRNNESLWNSEPLTLMVTISPPWWQTWWFRGLIVLALTGIAVFAARLYARRKVLAKTRELEQQHALNMERIRISKDVHDDIGSGLSKISLLSEIANRKIKENKILTGDIDNISTISKELVDNMRDLIWLLNPEHTTLDSLVARIREYSADFLDGMSVGVFFDFPENVPTMEISRDVQRNILLTVKEAINNSVKHAHAGILRIKLTISSGTLSVSISDNGRGFDVATTSGRGNGLRNMRQRIESIGGTCNITSQPASGTTIHLSVHLSKITVEP